MYLFVKVKNVFHFYHVALLHILMHMNSLPTSNVIKLQYVNFCVCYRKSKIAEMLFCVWSAFVL